MENANSSLKERKCLFAWLHLLLVAVASERGPFLRLLFGSDRKRETFQKGKWTRKMNLLISRATRQYSRKSAELNEKFLKNALFHFLWIDSSFLRQSSWLLHDSSLSWEEPRGRIINYVVEMKWKITRVNIEWFQVNKLIRLEENESFSRWFFLFFFVKCSNLNLIGFFPLWERKNLENW